MHIVLDGWQFTRLPLGSEISDLEGAQWQRVKVPHDWLIYDTAHLYEDGDGWYQRVLEADENLLASNVFLHFDGVYMDAAVYLNGHPIFTHAYGYTPFSVPLTPVLRAGENRIHVRVRHQAPNSRWYSGAGLYRGAELLVYPKRYFEESVYAHPEHMDGEIWRLTVRTCMKGTCSSRQMLSHRLLDTDGQQIAFCQEEPKEDGQEAVLIVSKPRLWSPEEPALYSLETILADEHGQILQTGRIRVGFRESAFSPDEGFILNGQRLKMHGVCLHHDLGALGAAFHPKAARRQLKLMKEMGVNALRTSHNPPASQLLDLCDEMGILVIDEFTDVWRHAKTAYDYARFFDRDARCDLTDMIVRDRSHPCVVLWSIGNEIMDTFSDPNGVVTTRMLRDTARTADPLRHAEITMGSNYMPWEHAQACMDELKIAGYNYAESYYEAHHARYADWVIYGSETMSSVQSRGIYHFPISQAILTETDLQCSSLGNSLTSWGTQDIQACLVQDLNTPYSMGQFVWSGIDYIGEPTPYHTRNAYFGQVDTAGFPKDSWYRYRALWQRDPVLHIGVSWDWNPGQMIDIPVYTNCTSVELFLNGNSLGRKAVNLNSPADSLPVWHCAFRPGRLLAVGYDAEGRKMLTDEQRTSGDPVSLRLTAEEPALQADGYDILYLTAEALDAAGIPVSNACDLVHVRVSGPVYLLGLDNGDSTDEDEYKADARRLFSGKMSIIIGAGASHGIAKVEVFADGLRSAECSITVIRRDGAVNGENALEPQRTYEKPETRWARAVRIEPLDSCMLTPEHPSAGFRLSLLPVSVHGLPVEVSVTNVLGIQTKGLKYEKNGDYVTVTGVSDGYYHLRAACNNGTRHPRLLSQMEIEVSGFGRADINPYEFVSAGLYTIHAGSITPGNEKGVAFARDGESLCGFDSVDFGSEGSDTLLLPVFALSSDPYIMTLWDGNPEEGGRRITDLRIQQQSIWNVYQWHRFTLPETLRGLHTLCFSMHAKVHLKGFRFMSRNRANMLHNAGDADRVYGDQFVRSGSDILEIGNNVTLEWKALDFGTGGQMLLRIDGGTTHGTNPIQVKLTDEAGRTQTEMCIFTGNGQACQRFSMNVPAGLCDLSFVFLPGSSFDFHSFMFCEDKQ